jgi:hypothetical protein
MNQATRLALLLVPALLPFSAQAAFKFENTLVESTPEFGQERMTAVFKFKNLDTPGTVRNIETSCGCLSATSDKASYAPGESGQVTAEFHIKGLTGNVERTITFVSGTKGEAPIRLAVRVYVPELIVVEPPMLNWAVGEAATPKTYKVTMRGPDPINIKSISSTRRNVAAEVKTITPGRVYEIKVSPQSTSDVLLGMVKIDTDTRFREQQRQMAFYRIDKKQ